MIDEKKSLFVCMCGGVFNDLLQGAWECGRCDAIMKIAQTKIIKTVRKMKRQVD